MSLVPPLPILTPPSSNSSTTSPPPSSSPPTTPSVPPPVTPPPAPPVPPSSPPPSPVISSPPPSSSPPPPVVSSPPPAAASSPPPPPVVAASPPPSTPPPAPPQDSSPPPPPESSPSPPAPTTTTSSPPPPSNTPSPPKPSPSPPSDTRSPPPPPSDKPSPPPPASDPTDPAALAPPPTPLPIVPREKPTPPASTNGNGNNTSSSPSPSGGGGGGVGAGGIAAIGVIVGLLLLSLFVLALWFTRKRKRKDHPGAFVGYTMPPSGYSSPQGSDAVLFNTNSSAPNNKMRSHSGNDYMYSSSDSGMVSNQRSWFSYDELAQVTNGFSQKNLLGQGGFGCVYKGVLADGREIAVKQLKIGGSQGEREFKAAALLGDDGRGFDLARRLEASGVWRTWLGDSIYLSFNHYLSSPSSWETFMRVDESKSRAQIQLQLRVRALLFDKATASLFLRSNSISASSASSDATSVAVSKLNHNYLQLHGDDVYYTLENASPEGGFQRDGGLRHNQSLPKSLSKPSFNSGRRGSESDFSNLAQRSRYEELPDTWYTQFISRCGFKYGMSVGGQESDKRTPERMSTYLRVVDSHKRKRAPFLEDRSTGSSGHMGRSNIHPGSGFDGSSSDDDILLPETMFRMNCVPETALSPFAKTQDDDVKTEFYGVLDTLPQVTTRSHVMIERLGMMPEYLRMEERGVLRRKKAEKVGFSDEQAAQVSRKVVARMLLTMGFEGATEVPVDVFSQLVSRHICKLGRILKVLTDSYKKECSATQLIKMFLNTTGYSNLGSLAELVKDGTRMIHHPQNQKQPQVLQQQLHMQQQAPQRLPQQIQRQMHPQMQQMVNPQSLQQQQQLLERMRKRQVTSPRPDMGMEKDRPLVQVKLENPSEMAVDGNAFNPMNPRHQQQMQQQFRQQQQIAALSNMQQQQQQQQPGYNQFRQLASMQIPQMQTSTTGTVRAQPVKVEGFEQLMGGDSSLKHETEDKLRSPPTK